LIRAGLLIACVVSLFAATPLHAFELYDSDGLQLRWDNDLRYSAGVRVESPNTLALGYPNSDDGDRDFAPGLMMNRFDLNSVLDLTGDDFGAQLSVEAWYDAVYQRRTANTSPATYNPSMPNSQFAPATVNLDGQYADLGDTFVYGNLTLGGVPLSMRLGRQTLLWGESLFFSEDGIAAGMAPIDYIKRTSTPDGYSRDVFLPVDQFSFTAQLQPGLSLAAYYQLEWRPDRLPGVGSYFSDSDVEGAGAYRAFLGKGQFLLHDPDRKAPDSGQYGVSLRETIGDFDLGLYALRFNAKYPVLQVQTAAPPLPSGYAGTFESVYPSGTDLYGFSFSTYVGDSNVAGEISGRRNMPLVSSSPISLTLLRPLGDNYGYAMGDTVHAQLSSVTTLGPTDFWNSADLSSEIAANNVLDVTRNPEAFDSNRTRFASSFRVLFQPHYFQVLPNLDVTPLVSLGYDFSGRSATDYTEEDDAGDAEFGVSATYLSVWKADVTFTSFFGPPYRQPLADRDFVMLSLERAF
jgi:hypothetical protein